jgi:sulfate adenylyltransferase large subunit
MIALRKARWKTEKGKVTSKVQTQDAIGGQQNGHTEAGTNSHDLLRIATAGSVDDGKSTLIGRLLLDSEQILADQLQAVERTSRERGDPYLELSLLTDGLRAEREQGITIDVCYRYFTTPARTFVIADTPGHVRYTRNMVTGASTADLSVILVDARNGVVEQSKRHAAIALLLRTPHVVVCVNKMDLVGYSSERFAEITEQFRSFAANFDPTAQITFIPVSALEGDNVVDGSQHMPWYEGPSLLSHLENVSVDHDPDHGDGRFPVQWVIRTAENQHGGYRGYAGQVTGGVLRPNDEVVVLPSGQRSRIASIDSHGEVLDAAFAPMSVSVSLSDDLDVGRGDLICSDTAPATVSRQLDAVVCWMSDRPVRAHSRYKLKHTTRTTQAVVDELCSRIEIETLSHDASADELALNDIGRLRLRTSDPLATDAYNRNRNTGSFILIDEHTHETAGAGMILDAAPEAASAQEVTEQGSFATLSRRQRFETLGQAGATVLFTGSSALSRHALMARVEQTLVGRGINAYRLDPASVDELADGATQRPTTAAWLSRLLADAATVVLVGCASDQDFDSHYARTLHEAHGLDFFEIAVDIPTPGDSKQPSLQQSAGNGHLQTAQKQPAEREVEREAARVCDFLFERIQKDS